MSTTQEDVQKAINRAYFYLKFRPRTELEVRRWLEKKSEKFYHWKPGIIDKALENLKENNYINDTDFAESYVKTRNAVKPKGEFVLRQELQKVGITQEILDDYFHENPPDEEALAKKILESRWSRYRSLDRKARFQKATQFLMRRGFNYSVAKKVIESLG